MLRKERNGVHWLEFELLSDIPHLKHAVFLRHGGHSQGNHASLNLSFNVNDHPKHVQANLDTVAAILETQRLIWGEQHHGTSLALIGPEITQSPYCDALATNASQIGLLIHHADCQAAIIYDPVNRAIVNVHCGWRGSVQNIYAHAIASMQTFFQSKPQNLLVGISPSLGPQSAEFIHYRKELPEPFWEFQVKPHYFDFWAISEMQLVQAGVLKDHIQIARIDTMSNPHDYFSYRFNKIRGGHGTIVALQK
jgi:YfiH family protein